MTERKGVLALLLLLLCWFAYAALISEAPAEGGGDNFQHYQIARWAFEYPHLFLDHWGKPFFTLLIAPFAQFGFTGAKIFNVLMGIFAAWLTFLVCKKLEIKNSWLVIIILCFMPMYFSMMNTTMTEILCSTMLIGLVYLFYCDKFIGCAVVASFLPFVRTETFVLVPIIGLALLLKKQIKTIPFLLTGFMLYSIIGWFYFHDFLWAINQNPYTGAKDIYGHGGPFDFLKANKAIWGIPTTILLAAGLIAFTFDSVKKKNKEINFEWLLIVLPAATHFILHSYLWWQGLGSSLGLIRVITCVLPLMAITSLRGFNLAETIVARKQFLKPVLAILTVALLVYIPFRNKAIVPPIQFSEPDKMAARACKWLKENNLDTNRIYFINPVVPIFLNKNQFDVTQMQFYFVNITSEKDSAPNGSIIFWDAHFGNNDGHLHLQRLIENKHYKILQLFTPLTKTGLALGNYENRIVLLQKHIEPDTTYVQPVLMSHDFENDSKIFNNNNKTEEQSFSQNYSYKLNHAYSPTLSYSLSKIKNAGYDTLIATVNVFAKNSLIENTTNLVISFERNGKQYSYNSTNCESTGKPDEWNQLYLKVAVPDSLQAEDIMKAYIWQPKGTSYIDDFEVSLK